MASPYDRDNYMPLDSFAFEQLAVAGTAVPLTAATYAPNGVTNGKPAHAAFCQVETAQIRMTLDGTTPTAAIGELLSPGDRFVIWGTMDIASARFIRVAGSGQLNVTYAR